MDKKSWQKSCVNIIKDQTQRAMWEVKNAIDCVPDDMWSAQYCEMPLYKHIYHMLHSLDQWFINPFCGYKEPEIHIENLNNLDVKTDKFISRDEINQYFNGIRIKIENYINGLTDDDLLKYPENSEYTRFTLILAQHRHLHSHMGMIMGFIIQATGKWPAVLGLTHDIPTDDYNKFF